MFGVIVIAAILTWFAMLYEGHLSKVEARAVAADPRMRRVPRPRTSFGDGRYVVGVDIAPGTYRSSGVPGVKTTWRRLQGKEGDGVIVTGGGTGPRIVTIKASDGSFESAASGGWTRISN